LTTENKQEPSSLFILLLSQGNPMTLVIVLLKIVLISKASRSHLEAQIAALIRYYERYPEQDCEWIVNFLEIFNVTFAIHAENVQYDLVNMRQKQENLSRRLTLNDYRVFSQMRSFPQSEESGNGTTP
jgi:glutaredoxin-related protein